MLKTIGVLVIIGLLIGAWGFHRGWFTVDGSDVAGSSHVTFGLDKEKLQRDTGTAHTSFDDAMKSLEKKLGELETRSQNAAAAERVSLDRAISACKVQRDEIARKLTRLKEATGAEIAELTSEIKQAFADAGAALDRALASSKGK